MTNRYSERRLGEGAFVVKEVGGEFENWTAIIDIARRQAEGEQFAAFIDHQVYLEAKEPAY